MKYIITNERLHSLIINYLDSNFVPDYGWSSKEFYEKEILNYNSIEFLINDLYSYYYNASYGYFKKEKVLQIETWVSNKLYGLFGEFWIPIFKEWFETNTSLQVKIMMYGGDQDSELSYTEEIF
jgi:hypothetical protein